MNDQIDVQVITKSDVPFFSTRTGVLGVFAFLAVILVVVLVGSGLYPGLLEICIGTAYGITVGLLVAWRHIALATRRAITNKNLPGPKPLWQPLDPDWGWTVLSSFIAILISIAALALIYTLWLMAPALSMPWARFAYSVRYPMTVPAVPGDSGFPIESMAAMGISAWFSGHLVETIRVLQWYASLPPHPSPTKRNTDCR